MAADARDQREAPRRQVEAHVSLRSEHNFYTGFTENISSGGLFVATRDLLPIGSHFDVRFTLPTSPNEIVARCEVRWQRLEQLDDAECTPGMGVRFLNLSSEDERAIHAFMAQRETLFYDDA